MWPNPQFPSFQFPTDFVTFTEEILHGKLPFLCSETLIKTVIKILKGKTPKMYIKHSSQTVSWKTISSKQLFIPLLRTSEGNTGNNGWLKWSRLTLTIFFSKVINSEHFTQTKYNDNFLYKIDQSLKFDLFKV